MRGERPQGRRRLGRIILASGLLILFWIVQEQPWSQPIFTPLSRLTAAATWWMLELGGLPVVRDGLILTHAGGFAYRIDPLCTALLPVGVLLAALWIVGGGRTGWRAAIAGALLMTLLNQLRLVSLMWIGVHHPDRFDLAHEWLWPLLLTGVGLAFLSLARRGAPTEASP